ncbi:hypothetical protein AAVH_31039 [Aphelenchoides avenae]|nr:hypothetical protein AAVH_31039 [Aphelenchus avenae]
MPTSPVEFLKIDDWTHAFYDGIIWTHQKIDEMDSCLEEIRLLHAESLATPGLQRPTRWRELNENVLRFNMLHNAVVDLVNTAFDALNTCWENNDDDYTYKYMEAKPLRRRFEKTAEAFNAENAEFGEKAREKVTKHLAGLLPPGLAGRPSGKKVKHELVTSDPATSSTAVNPGSSNESPFLPSKPTRYEPMALAPKCVKRTTHSVVDDKQNTTEEKKPTMKKVFICDVCSKKLGSLQGLNDHKKDAHGVPIEPPPTAPKHAVDEYHRSSAYIASNKWTSFRRNKRI